MAPKAGYSTPLLHVADVARSLRFYELLGFEAVDVEGEGQRPSWARVHCEGGALMLLATDEPVQASSQSVMLYMYTNDLVGLREHLLASGLAVAPIRRPEYMPGGEISLADPDGYRVLVGHWGQAEHEAWEAARQSRLAAAARGRTRP